jgi:hypothetical protein
LYFFLLVSLFCCEFTNTIIVLFVMTYIWHLYVANKDVFTWSTTSYIKYEFYFINIRQTRLKIQPESHSVKTKRLIEWMTSQWKKASLLERSLSASLLSNLLSFFSMHMFQKQIWEFKHRFDVLSIFDGSITRVWRMLMQ